MKIDVPNINGSINNDNRANVEAINLILMSPYTAQETRNNLCIYLHERNITKCDKETVGSSLRSTVLKYCGDNDVLIIYEHNHGYYESCIINISNKFDVYSCKDNIDYKLIKSLIKSKSKQLGTIYICNNSITGSNLIFNEYSQQNLMFNDDINTMDKESKLWYIPFLIFLIILGFIVIFFVVRYFVKRKP